MSRIITLLIIAVLIVFIGVTFMGCSRSATNDKTKSMQLVEITQVNSYVNKTIKPVGDGEGKDYWQKPEETIKLGTGDCEDYAILKGSLLKDYPQKLSITRTLKDGTGHALLRVTIGKEYYYLDNRLPYPLTHFEILTYYEEPTYNLDPFIFNIVGSAKQAYALLGGKYTND